MTRCERCGATMKPLFSSSYCPNECDRKATVPSPDGPSSAALASISMDNGWEAYHFPAGTRLTDASWASHGLWVNPDPIKGLERTREILQRAKGPLGAVWRINSAEHGRFVVQKFSENGLGLALFRRAP